MMQLMRQLSRQLSARTLAGVVLVVTLGFVTVAQGVTRRGLAGGGR